MTWDRGRETATHQQLTAETGCPVCFCAPRSPWQRGTNEYTNELLRQYLGKSDDLSKHSQAELNLIAARLNARPRKVLSWRSSSEVCASDETRPFGAGRHGLAATSISAIATVSP